MDQELAASADFDKKQLEERLLEMKRLIDEQRKMQHDLRQDLLLQKQ